MNHESIESKIKVFISYSHDSHDHVSRVYALAQTLRIDGIDCNIDQFALAPDNWDRWMLDQIESADFVLIICSERYYRRYRGKEEPGNGLGVTWESTLIMGQLYERQGFNTKFYPVFFERPDRSLIPDGIRTSYYSLSDVNIADLPNNQSRLSQESGYETLYRLLTNQPSSQPFKTGSLVRLELPKSGQHIQPTPLLTAKDKAELLFNNDLKQMPYDKGPYQGLSAFSSATRKYFFGRTDITTKTLDRFKISRFCILSGNSGVGKSSLLEAGLLPSLREEGWTIPRSIRPGPDPISELNSVLLEALRITKASKFLLRSQLRSRCNVKNLLPAAFGERVNRRVVFVVDQLEEVFTLSIDQGIQSEFFGIITEIIESNHPGVGVILVIRSDFTGRCLDDSQLSKFFNDQANVIYITPMKGESIRKAIVEPAKKLNYCVEDGLVSELIEEASRQTGSLPLLQFALSRLWELSSSEPGLLTLDSYNRLGGLSEILNGYADKVLKFKDYQSNNPADHRTAAEVDSIKRIFLKLVRPGRRLGEEYDTRQRVSMEQLAAIKPASISDSAFHDLIQDLIDSRLIVGGGRANEIGWIDLAHETLTSAWSSFARWLKVDRDVRRLAERIHDDYIYWLMGLQSDEYLLSGGLLRDSLARVEKLLPYLGKELESFLDKSRAYNEIKLGYRLAERRRYTEESQFTNMKKPRLTKPPKGLPGFEDKALDLLNKYSLAVGSLRLPTPGCYADPDRAGPDAVDVFDGMTEHLFYTLGKLAPTSSRWDLYTALSYAVRDRLMTRYLAGSESINATPTRVIAYLSAEFLIGPQLNSNLMLLGIQKEAAEALRTYGIADIDEILEVEEEPGLGMSGLGRLAACFMESLASLQIPATGYGIRYEFGIFDQLIRDGWQVEITDKWLKSGFPWEIPHPDQSCFVGFGGRTESCRDDTGRCHVRWIPAEHALGVPHDVLVLGYRVNTCGRLRLWRAEATESFDFYAFNIGDYYGAVEEKVGSETLSKVLYPNDGTDEGRRLRLKQQFFFVSCSLQDMLRSLEIRGIPVQEFPDHWAVQLNDTQPAIAVPELMRLLLDDKNLEWNQAWDITTRSLAYTYHTLQPEALEKWSLDLFGSLLPRHLEIIYEINRRFLQQVRLKYPGNPPLSGKLSARFDPSTRGPNRRS